MTFEDMIPEKWYQFGYDYVRFKRKLDRVVESYPSKISNVYLVDYFYIQNWHLETDVETVKNPEWQCIKEIDKVELSEAISFIDNRAKILKEILDSSPHANHRDSKS